MLRIAIPGRGPLELAHLVCDVNGTLAKDGQLLPGVAERFAALGGILRIHLLTADTHGTITPIAEAIERACREAGTTGPQWRRVETGAEKVEYVRRLGVAQVVAVGNGANDAAMFRVAALSVAIMGAEGLFVPTLLIADVVTASPLDALDLLRYPVRLTATLRL